MAMPLWAKKLLIQTRLAGLLPVAKRITDGGASYLRYYSDRVLAAPVEELLDPGFVAGPCEPDVLDLNVSIPQCDAALGRQRLEPQSHCAHSPRGTHELRNAIADHYVRTDGREIDPERDVCVTHGAAAAFAAALDAFANPADGIVLFDPCSPLFALGAKSRRAAIRWVPTWTEDGRLRFPTAAFESAMRGAKMLVLCDPMNPTGARLSNEDREYIAWIAASYDVLIYSDESYRQFRYDERVRSVSTMTGAAARTLVTESAARGWGLSAARVGWLTGHRHLVQACTLSANLSAPWVSPAAQQLTARALSQDLDTFAPTLAQFRSRRDYSLERLRVLGLEAVAPAGGYFLWVSVASLGMDGRTFAERLLRDQRVSVGPGYAFGPSGAPFVRLSFALDDGRLREGISRMSAFVKGERAGSPMPNIEAEVEPHAVSEAMPQFSRV